MCNKQNNTCINIKITDIILTPLTCAVLINEVIKYLVYQKSQIPYPYNWLQTVITRKRKKSESASTQTTSNVSVERHYKIAASAYDTVEEMMSNIKAEFKNGFNIVREVLIVFGATPLTPKEVFRINIPTLHHYHVEANHLKSIPKNQQKILRNLFLSQDWLKAMDNNCTTTNMYLMVRKHQDVGDCEDKFFIPVSNPSVPINSRCVTINFDYKNENDHICCSNISVYSDGLSNTHTNSNSDILHSDIAQDVWCQAKLFLKGYKDCFVNKVSATELF